MQLVARGPARKYDIPLAIRTLRLFILLVIFLQRRKDGWPRRWLGRQRRRFSLFQLEKHAKAWVQNYAIRDTVDIASPPLANKERKQIVVAIPRGVLRDGTSAGFRMPIEVLDPTV